MKDTDWKKYITSYNERWNAAVLGSSEDAISFAAHHFIEQASTAIQNKGVFAVALSGGSTPKKIIERITSPPFHDQIDWERVLLFWGDERAVSPSSEQSNYKMAMDAGLQKMPIPKEHIFRMHAEKSIQEHARKYEQLLLEFVPNGAFDLILLGMGEDAHTASLFPTTEALYEKNRLVVANFVPKLNQWRMTLTFPAINRARAIVIYVLGKQKAHTLEQVLSSPDNPDLLPIQRIGTPANQALWVTDIEAIHDLLLS